ASAVGTCASPTDKCVPKVPGAVGPCVAQNGDHSCPADYTQKTLYFDGVVDDKRSCETGSCTCGGPTGGTCACGVAVCGVNVYNINSCTQNSKLSSVIDGGGCKTYDDSGWPSNDGKWGVALSTGYSVSTPGTCPASGTGTPSGEVSPTGPVTVCCVP
nr:hypothetical protein [Polyangiaceae bacterium]